MNNRTTTPLAEDRLTARLATAIHDNKVTAVEMDSPTTSDKELHPTVENGREMESKNCDYVLLTRIVNLHVGATDGSSPEISIGGKVPSIDASDPLGGQSGPVHRENVEINFAIFRAGNPKPLLDNRILDRPSGHAADSLMQAMDREGNRVNHEMKKK